MERNWDSKEKTTHGGNTTSRGSSNVPLHSISCSGGFEGWDSWGSAEAQSSSGVALMAEMVSFRVILLSGRVSHWENCWLKLCPSSTLFTNYTEKQVVLLFACVTWVSSDAILEFCRCSWLDQFCVSLKFPSFTTCTCVTVWSGLCVP